MKKRFLPLEISFSLGIALALGTFFLFVLWFSGGGIKAGLRDFLSPLAWFQIIFKNEETQPERLAELEAENALLKSKIEELKQGISLTAPLRPKSIKALILSQAPSVPYDTLLANTAGKSEIKVGSAVLAHQGILIGEIQEAGGKVSLIKLISFPGFKTEAWLERLSLNVTLEGQGGYNLKFSLPKNVELNIGDRVLSNSEPAFLIGYVEYIKSDTNDPLAEVMLRLPMNFRNLRYVDILY